MERPTKEPGPGLVPRASGDVGGGGYLKLLCDTLRRHPESTEWVRATLNGESVCASAAVVAGRGDCQSSLPVSASPPVAVFIFFRRVRVIKFVRESSI